MTRTRFTVLDDTQRHLHLAERIDQILHQVAPTSSGGTPVFDPLSRSAGLDSSRRMDRITAAVLHLLFDLTQQSARFSSGSQPWASLAAYDADDFASFTTGGTR